MPPPSSLAVVPRRPLRRLPVALEHPVAELAAHREHAAEEAGIAQPRASQAGQEQLVLHDAVLDALLLGEPADRERLVEIGRDRLLAIDVLAGRDRLGQQRRRASAWSRRRRRRCRRVGERRVEVGGPARDAVLLGERLDLLGVAADQDRIGITRSPFGSVTPPWSRIATIERIRCWFSPMRPVTPFMMMPRIQRPQRRHVAVARPVGLRHAGDLIPDAPPAAGPTPRADARRVDRRGWFGRASLARHCGEVGFMGPLSVAAPFGR
jgi:hypothetical protein